MSPYPLKLETFLRILGIKYVVDYNKPRGSKGKSPWINFNGQELTDSQLILEYLSRYFEKDLDGRLDDTDRAIARMTRVMVEERYYWCGALERYREGQGLKDKELFAPFPFVPRFLDGFIKGRVAKGFIKNGNAHGVGRHSVDTLRKFGLGDLEAVSEILGTDDYFFGGSEPCVLDITVFSFVCMIMFCSPETSVYQRKVEEDLVNLKEHMLRMKRRFWPDWDECLAKRE